MVMPWPGSRHAVGRGAGAARAGHALQLCFCCRRSAAPGGQGGRSGAMLLRASEPAAEAAPAPVLPGELAQSATSD